MRQMEPGKRRILYVDDEKENLTNFKYVFRRDYEIHLALSADEAYRIMQRHDIHVVIADQRMPGETGVEFLERIVPQHPNTVRIILTGYSDIESVIHAINRSKIYYYLQKPWHEDEMRMVIDNALQYFRSRNETKRLLAGLKQTSDTLGQEIAGLRQQVTEKTKLLDEIRSSREQLQVSEERLRAIFDAAQDSIFVKDRSLKYTHVNPSMLRLFQVRPDQIIGRTDDRLLHDGLPENLKSIETRVLAGQPMEAEYTIEVHGSQVVLSSTRTPLRDAFGAIVGLCGILRDITGRRPCVPTGEPFESPQYVSKSMTSAMERLLLAARSDSTVLFLGESGSGKDFLAKYLHDQSRRAGGPFYAINCAALPTELAESELFGHEPGAFTGSRGRKRGLVELAEGGTLLLNEIGELAWPIQAKLLAFLDTKSFTRVGGEKPVVVNARIVAATNRDLRSDVESRKFRQDLFYRLNVLPILVPPLRNRMEDLSILVRDLLTRLSFRLGLSEAPPLEPDALGLLNSYSWPGNVRELENVLERALILSGTGTITKSALVLSQDGDRDGGTAQATALQDWDRLDGSRLNELVDRAKQSLIADGLRRCNGNVTKTAELLGISRGSLKHYMSRLKISSVTFRK